MAQRTEQMDVDAEDTNPPPATPSSTASSTPSRAMDAEKKAALQQKLKQKVMEYRRIVVDGCGDWRCSNEFCRSNLSNRDKVYSDKMASTLALRMVQSKHSPCRSFPRRPAVPLRPEELKILEMDTPSNALAADPEAAAALSAASESVLRAFSEWHHFFESFPTDSAVSEQSAAIDHDAMDRVFAAVLRRDSLRENAADALCDTMTKWKRRFERIAESKASPPPPPLSLDVIRVFVILMECPLVLSEDIGCFGVLTQWLEMMEVVIDSDSVLGATSAMKQWLSEYRDIDRLRDLVNALQQFLTLTVEEQEDAIEDLTDEWKVEMKYDSILDPDARDGVQQAIEKRQQSERERYMKSLIFPAIKVLDIIYNANQLLTKKLEAVALSKLDGGGDGGIGGAVDDEKKENDNAQRHRIRLSAGFGANNERLVGRRPLSRRAFHNDGLNEALCSRSSSRSLIHRRDLINYREAEHSLAERGGGGRTVSGSLLSFPYLLTAGSKARYLEFENLLRQHRARRRRMMDLMMGGAMGGIMGGLNRNRLMEALDLVLRITRKDIVRDTVAILALQQPGDLRKRLRIIFDGEQGVDQGGLTKEFFQLIMRELFDPKYGMFRFNEQTQCFWFERDCFLLSESRDMALSNYEMVGKLVGIAIYNNTILELRFPRVIFKKLLGSDQNIDFGDFADFDPEMAKGFEQLLAMTEDDDVEAMYCRNFVVSSTSVLGDETSFDLLTLSAEGGGGDAVMLNHSNRRKYVELYIEYVLDHSVREQFDAFLRGFRAVCDSQLFQKYDAEELELLICGSKEFDFEALELSTKYEDGLHRNSQIVRDFWAVAHDLTESDKRKLLSFCTGSDRVPINGLGQLALTISRNGAEDAKLPTSHTCFNHLLLPEYSTRDILRRRLLTAIQNSEGFGLL